MTTSNNFLVRLNIPDALIPRLRQAQNEIVKGLLAIQLSDGWSDTHLVETQTSTWTSAIILKSLLRHGVIANNYLTVVEKIIAARKEKDGLSGWIMDERFSQWLSTYVTADILSLLLSLNKFTEAESIIRSLQAIRNSDGAWGVCPKDEVSKVRPTIWVLQALLDAYDHPVTERAVNFQIIKDSVKWLYNAQNDEEEDYGWGFLSGSSPSSVSCTSGVLYILLRIVEGQQESLVKRESLRRAIQTLKNMGTAGFWKGDVEDFGIMIDGQFVGRHITGGLGTLSVVMTLLKAVNVGLLSPDDPVLFQGIENILLRCRSYAGKDGAWIAPSEQGGPPIIWNSAYALDAINEIQRFHLNILEGSYIERKVFDTIYARVNFWKKLAIALIVAIIGATFGIYLRGVTPVLDWFANMSPLIQGLILITITIVSEEMYHRLFKPTFVRWRQRQDASAR